MGLPVRQVPSGGMPVVDVSGTTPRLGLPVTTAANGYGIPITLVVTYGIPVTFVVPPL